MDNEELKNRIKADVDCRDFLEKSLHDDPKSSNYTCPFCGSGTGPNKTGALKYHPDTNTFYCNKCGKHGDSIDLIEKKYGCGFIKALVIGRSLLGIGPEGNEEKRRQFLKWYASEHGLEFNEIYSYCYGSYKDGLAKVRFTDSNGCKTFRWIHDDETNKSGFRMSHKGCRNRLFVAGDLSKGTCVVTEGEKDAVTVYNLYEGQVTAVSAENGATEGNTGSKWRPEYNEQLKGKNVYILSDNDEAGRNFAASVAAEIRKTANEVYLLDILEVWPECPPKGDITDMVNTVGPEEAKKLLSRYISKIKQNKDINK